MENREYDDPSIFFEDSTLKQSKFHEVKEHKPMFKESEDSKKWSRMNREDRNCYKDEQSSNNGKQIQDIVSVPLSQLVGSYNSKSEVYFALE